MLLIINIVVIDSSGIRTYPYQTRLQFSLTLGAVGAVETVQYTFC